ncbi:MAG TPA: discoidin domain-containing protein, partial [Bacteroidota bacterium]|nr:discoidin domain-containing protein [Bacteroidota bacterium]
MIFPLFYLLASLLPTSAQSLPRSQLLDDFSTLSGWKTIVSDGAALTLHTSTDAAGASMQMDFDLSGGAGYAIAEKNFTIDLPANYQFSFDLRGETPVNNFEFKILDEHENVHWIKKLNVTYPTTWTRQRIKKRHLSFAWGPAPGKELKHVRALQFVVSAGTGGKGSIWIDNFRFEPLDEQRQSEDLTVIQDASTKTGTPASGMTSWTSRTLPDSLVMDFDYVREVGGVVIDWDSAGFAESYDVLLSDDGTLWNTAYSVLSGKPGRAYVPCGEAEGRYLKLLIRRSHRGERAIIRGMEIKGPSFSSSANTLYRAIATDSPRGFFPKYFQDQQSYWTVLGVSGDTKEALMNEEGQVEVDRLRFSLEPFLFADGQLITWNHVTTQPSLRNGYLPIPAVTWTCKNAWELTIEAVAGGTRGHSFLGVRYSLKSTANGFRGKLFIAIRPFQVNPPWQALNIEGGTALIDSIAHRNGVVIVDGTPVIPFEAPSGFGALEFDQGDITGFLARGELPPVQHVKDHAGHASAALAYDFNLGRGQTKEISLAIPF